MRGMGSYNNKSSTTLMLFYSMIIGVALAGNIGEKMSHDNDHDHDQHMFNLLKGSTNTVTRKLEIFIRADFNIGSPNQTVFTVASAEITPQSPSNFGRVIVIDNPLSFTRDGSEYAGQYQGMNTYADFKEPAPNMYMNMILSGEYNGSTLTIMGRQPINDKVRVLSIVGGTGVFRFAKGIALASTISVDSATQIGYYVYRMCVVTPDPSAAHRREFSSI